MLTWEIRCKGRAGIRSSVVSGVDNFPWLISVFWVQFDANSVG